MVAPNKIADAARAAMRENTGAWWEVHGRISDKAGNIVRPQLNFLQITIERLVAFCEAHNLPVRILVLKPRQKGSTTYSGANLYHRLRRRRTSACIIGGQYSQTANAWKIVDLYNRTDRYEWGNEGAVNQERGTWSHGSELVPETARDYDAGRSGTFQALLATEVARWSEEGAANAREVLAGILKCVPALPDTIVILETTAKGASGDFYERWGRAKTMEEFMANPTPGDYVRVFAPWFEFEDSTFTLTPEQKDEIRTTLDAEEWYQGEQELIDTYGNNEAGFPRLGNSVEKHDVWEQLAWRRWAIENECERDVEVFNQDYPDTPENAFLRSGRRRFNNAGLAWLSKRKGTRKVRHGVLDDLDDGARAVWRDTSVAEATIHQWEAPLEGRRYLITADPMTGASQTVSADPDCHAVFVMRAGWWEHGRGWHPPAVVARIAPPCRWDIDILESQVWRLARYYGGTPQGCLIVPEINMDRGLVELLKLRGARIYERKQFNRREDRFTGALGWQTNSATRESMIEGLARAIREYGRDGEGLDLWCSHAIGELENFIVKPSGRSEAESGWHDDDVLALAIGLATIEGATPYVVPRISRPLPRDLARYEANKARLPARYAGYS